MIGAILNLDQIGTPAKYISIGVPFGLNEADAWSRKSNTRWIFQKLWSSNPRWSRFRPLRYIYYAAKSAAKE